MQYMRSELHNVTMYCKHSPGQNTDNPAFSLQYAASTSMPHSRFLIHLSRILIGTLWHDYHTNTFFQPEYSSQHLC